MITVGLIFVISCVAPSYQNLSFNLKLNPGLLGVESARENSDAVHTLTKLYQSLMNSKPQAANPQQLGLHGNLFTHVPQAPANQLMPGQRPAPSPFPIRTSYNSPPVSSFPVPYQQPVQRQPFVQLNQQRFPQTFPFNSQQVYTRPANQPNFSPVFPPPFQPQFFPPANQQQFIQPPIQQQDLPDKNQQLVVTVSNPQTNQQVYTLEQYEHS